VIPGGRPEFSCFPMWHFQPAKHGMQTCSAAGRTCGQRNQDVMSLDDRLSH
jgi:hypothetical protein